MSEKKRFKDREKYSPMSPLINMYSLEVSLTGQLFPEES